MKWVFIGIGSLALAATVSALVFWYVAQKNIKDKGGMENPNKISETQSSAGKENTDKPLDE